MPTTSNFGWTTPADTDLVKDGALAIRTLGNGIDTSLVDLKGGTTGQNLRKASNTDLDFTFAGDATNTVVDAAGDLLYGTAADTLGRLAIGTANQVLRVNSGATAPEWATPASSNKNFTLLNTGGTALTGAATITVSGISNADQIFVLVQSASSASASSFFRMRFNGDSGNNYQYATIYIDNPSTYSAAFLGSEAAGASSGLYFGKLTGNASSAMNGYLMMSGCNTAGVKVCHFTAGPTTASSNAGSMNSGGAVYNSSSTISSVSIVSETGNFDAGTIYVYTTA